MKHHVTVVWHDQRAGESPLLRRKAKLVEVRERPNPEEYFLGGLLNQAMRQHGYPEEEIHAQKFVGPVEFIWPLKSTGERSNG